MTPTIKVIIPAYNEQDSIANVINDIPKIVDEVIVVSNNSTDHTEINAKNAGATVLKESKKGYGYACLKGMEYISKQNKKPEIIVFLDGDYSDYPEQLTKIIAPIIHDHIDFVIGSRVKKLRESGSMTPQQVFGNWLATFLMKLFFGAKFTDLGPFRAIKYDKLLALKMQDKTYGWTVEMQLKALKQKLTYAEIPVKYRNRIGVSKVSGTIKGSIFAGIKILGWIFKYSFK
ncbi:Glycosyltransferase involved in cell wall bisynthesis [Polaribacter sp. Hel1_33_78]|jgi:glycosyltransferase involved in cell wall biosynthesis|uniref:glycosyltransferase family 2 protein n=1 Tax=unclassified Polaribacter TaxID=196858 RepID=UPI00052E1836|nr:MULTISPECIES: glycosyltransferase family 2 protein [unclassified Polaribacter]KGL59818.1 glycosyltransferase, GT2 family [Polaribacter sp. Hel1_33_49]MBT3742955.1 glycosyltransferase family 2 protein [Polaribacter sp.]MDG1195940.1 glycosyltransferase family 2 protein [Polaribacter sp.]MDG1404055.1 glycosyltransferase family 2 protein [Polaribacter sp.]MDG2436898.1 glycosyltransferase family 2 protein [Polaribacter sp.]